MEVSLSQRSRKSNSKKGIQVTLSKQKQNLSHSKYDSFSEKTPSNQAYQVQKKNGIKLVFAKQSQPTGSYIRQSNESAIPYVKPNLVANYLQKSQKKSIIINQSEKLDFQIKQLQLEIYNTRTKISEVKYLSKRQEQLKSIQNIERKKSPKKHKFNQNGKEFYNLAIKEVQKQKQTLSKNYKSLKKGNQVDKIQKFNQVTPLILTRNQSRSRSPSPVHPSVLKKLIQSKQLSQVNHQKQNHQNSDGKSYQGNKITKQQQARRNENSKLEKVRQNKRINQTNKQLYGLKSHEEMNKRALSASLNIKRSSTNFKKNQQYQRSQSKKKSEKSKSFKHKAKKNKSISDFQQQIKIFMNQNQKDIKVKKSGIKNLPMTKSCIVDNYKRKEERKILVSKKQYHQVNDKNKERGNKVNGYNQSIQSSINSSYLKRKY